MRLLVAIMQSRNKCSLLKYDKKRLGCDNPVLFIITQAGQIKYTYLNKVAKLNATKYTVNQPNTNISMQRESAMFLIFRLKVLTTPDSVVLNSRHIHLFPYFEIRRVYASMVVLGSRGVTILFPKQRLRWQQCHEVTILNNFQVCWQIMLYSNFWSSAEVGFDK